MRFVFRFSVSGFGFRDSGFGLSTCARSGTASRQGRSAAPAGPRLAPDHHFKLLFKTSFQFKLRVKHHFKLRFKHPFKLRFKHHFKLLFKTSKRHFKLLFKTSCQTSFQLCFKCRFNFLFKSLFKWCFESELSSGVVSYFVFFSFITLKP